MRRILIAAAAVCSLAGVAAFSSAADDTHTKVDTYKGVLIDNACGAKQMKKDDPEKSAAGHPKDCTLKCGKDGGFAVVTGKHMYKFDDNGNKLAKDYLENHDSMKVVVKGVEKDDQIIVTSLSENK